MLAGHPDLFAPPELHLAQYRDMQERARYETSPDRDQGLVVAVAELYACDRDRAQATAARFLEENWSTDAVFAHLQAAAAPRLLVEKSPGNANRIETLLQLEESFEAPRYVHLYRHPYSVIESVKRNRFAALMGTPGLEAEELGDYLWHRSNSNISAFLNRVPDDRKHALAYEDLVTDPEGAGRSLCKALGVRFDPAILTPYEGRRMRDGLGDPNLADHDRIRRDLANGWRRQVPAQRLSQDTAALARSFGYDLLARDLSSPRRAPAMVSRADWRVLSVEEIEAVTLRPPARSSGRALVCVHALDGSVDLYRALADRMQIDGPVIGLGLEREAARCRPWSIPDLAGVHAAKLSQLDLGAFDLLGWSFGGMVAFEIAQIIGHCAAVQLLDTPAPFNRGPRSNDGMDILASFVGTLFATFRPPVPLGLAEAIAKVEDVDAALDIALDILIRADIVPETAFRNDVADRFTLFWNNTVAANLHERTDTGGPVRLLRADRTPAQDETELIHPNFTHPDGVYGWSAVSREVNADSADGTHYTMLGPDYTIALARAIPLVPEVVPA